MEAASADPAVAWLLRSTDPSVRYLTLTEVVGRPREDPLCEAALEDIPDGPRVRGLLSGQREDGGFGVNAYAKWTGGFWRLVALAELAVPASHGALGPLIDHVLRWLWGERRAATPADVGGRVRAHATQDGYTLAALCVLGRADDPRASRIADSLVAWQWPDGGWNCDRSPGARHSSFHETHGPLWGLAELLVRGSRPRDDVVLAAEKAAEFLLRHHVFRAERSRQIADPVLVQPRFPPYWHYDLLQGLWVLSRLGRAGDPRAAEALDVLEAKRRSDGLWRAEGHWWKPPGSTGSNVEVVDWGRRGANEWVTLRALRVLKAAGRLE